MKEWTLKFAYSKAIIRNIKIKNDILQCDIMSYLLIIIYIDPNSEEIRLKNKIYSNKRRIKEISQFHLN